MKGVNGMVLLKLKTSTDFRMMGLIGENMYSIISHWKCGFEYLGEDLFAGLWYDCQSWCHQRTENITSETAAGFIRYDIDELIKDVCCYWHISYNVYVSFDICDTQCLHTDWCYSACLITMCVYFSSIILSHEYDNKCIYYTTKRHSAILHS